jgi:hypothetical protein
VGSSEPTAGPGHDHYLVFEADGISHAEFPQQFLLDEFRVRSVGQAQTPHNQPTKNECLGIRGGDVLTERRLVLACTNFGHVDNRRTVRGLQ